MDNKQYRELIADVRTTCLCTEEQAKYIITLCTRLNADVYEFIQQLPRLMGKVTPSAEEVIAEMEKVATKNGVALGGVSMPKGYANRTERRKKRRPQDLTNVGVRRRR